MQDRNPVRAYPYNEIWWGIFALLACAQFTLRYVWRGGSFLNLERYANGQEAMPYQGRVLMAWILHATAGNPHLSRLFAHVLPLLPDPINNAYSAVLLVVDFIAIVACIVAGRFTLQYLTGNRVFSMWAALLTLYMGYFNLIVGYGIYMMPYDLVSLAVFSIAVWLILTERYLWLLTVFIIGTLNRETTIFLTLFLAIHTWLANRFASSPRRSWPRVAPHIAIQVAVWLALRAWIHYRFLGNPQTPGSANNLFLVHLVSNLVSIAKPQQWPLLLSLFGFSLPLFFVKFKRIGDRALAWSTAMMLVAWTAMMIVVGVVVEIRVFNELTAFLMPCIALILWNDGSSWFRAASVTEGSE